MDPADERRWVVFLPLGGVGADRRRHERHEWLGFALHAGGRQAARSRSRDAWRAASARPRSPSPPRRMTAAVDAVFTTSPATRSPICGPSPKVTSASPVCTAIRTGRLPSVTRSRMASAARTARSGSSSWAIGAPNTPIAASPMNLSKRATEPLDLLLRHGMERHEDAPDVLGVGAVAVLGEPGEVGEDDRDEPAFLERRVRRTRRSRGACRTTDRTGRSEARRRRTFGHRRASCVPHDAQKRAVSSFIVWHEGQGIDTRRVYRRPVPRLGLSRQRCAGVRRGWRARSPSPRSRGRRAVDTTTGTSMP